MRYEINGKIVETDRELSESEIDEIGQSIGEVPEAAPAAVEPSRADLQGLDMEMGKGKGSEFPTAAMSDVTIPDALAVQGVAGLGKAIIPSAIRKWTEAQLARTAQNQMLKSTGASLGQIRQVGPDAAREAAQYGIDKGLGDILTTNMGRDARMAKLLKTTGKDIGKARKAAGTADKELLGNVEKSVSKKYKDPLYEGQEGALDKALRSVKQLGDDPTHADLATKARLLNKFATKNKLTQPTGAMTDVANSLSAANDAAIAQKLGPEAAKQYVDKLSEFSKQKLLKNFMTRGEARETAGRGGMTAFGSLSNLIKDTAGHRIAAKGADTLAGAVGNVNPIKSAAKLTPAAIAEWLARQEEEGMSEGGIVESQPKINDISDEIKKWVMDKSQAYKASDYGTLKGLRTLLQQTSPKPEPKEDKDEL